MSLALIAGCSAPQAKPEGKPAAAEPQIKTVKTAKVTRQIIADPDEVVADLLPSVQMDVILKVDGDVEQVVAERGQYVKEGDLLLKIDDSDAISQEKKAELAVKSAEAQLSKSRQDLENSKKEMQASIDKMQDQVNETEKQYNKMHNDYDLGLVTRKQLEDAETNLNNLKKDLEVLKQKYDTLVHTDSLAALEVQLQTSRLNVNDAKKALGYYDVKAPIGGLLTELIPKEGMTLARGTKVAQIQQLNPIKIHASLSQAAYQEVQEKKELKFHLSGSSDMLTGKISYLGSVVNSQTHAYDLEMEVPNEELTLKPGMKVQVQLNDVQDQNVIVVPTTSIVREGADTYVFVLNNDIAEKRKVELGRLKDANQEVISGLKENEVLIVSGQQQLKDKEKVNVAQ
jgi:multidrug efflux pump subunit AcrA (membrane-fusion protein)